MISEEEYDKLGQEFGTSKIDYKNGPPFLVRIAKCGSKEYKSIFVFSHSLADGSSISRILGTFHQILDDVASGIDISSDLEQIGYFANSEDVDKAIDDFVQEMKQNKELQKPFRDFYNSIQDYEVPLKNYFGPKVEVSPQMGFIERILSKDLTSKLIQRCHQEGVTVNSAISIAFNWYFYQMTREQCPNIEDRLMILHTQNVNTRRYWQNDREFGLGAHFTTFFQTCFVDKKNLKNFWDDTRAFHKRMHDDIRNKIPLKNIAYNTVQEIEDDMFFRDDLKSVLEVCYNISNTGNLDPYFKSSPNMIQGTYLSRLQSFHHLYTAYFIHTFGGRLYFDFNFGKLYITEEKAQEQLEKMIEILINHI